MADNRRLIHLQKEKELARAIQRFHGKSYYFATAFFPRDIREAIYILYAFFRVPDEIVDTAHKDNLTQARKELYAWQENMRDAFSHKHSKDPILHATQHIFHVYHIPLLYADNFIDAMILDTEKSRYESYEELVSYMNGSAVAVGYIVSSVIGYADGALPYAKALGEAMQLTNFIRDIKEDMDTRGRIYIPQDELRKFGVRDEIERHMMSAEFRECVAFQVRRARSLYRIAERGIPLLSKKGRFPVMLALRLYEGILDEVEKYDYDVFVKRHRVTFWKKIYYVCSVVLYFVWTKK